MKYELEFTRAEQVLECQPGISCDDLTAHVMSWSPDCDEDELYEAFGTRFYGRKRRIYVQVFEPPR